MQKRNEKEVNDKTNLSRGISNSNLVINKHHVLSNGKLYFHERLQQNVDEDQASLEEVCV